MIENGSDDESLNSILKWSNKINIQHVYYNREQAILGGNKVMETRLSKTKSKDRLVIIDNKENLGFSAGANVGIQYAIASGGDYVWLLNNDTIVNGDVLNKMINVFTHNKYFKGITPKIIEYENPDKIWSAGQDLTWYGRLKSNPIKKKMTNQGESVFAVSFITNCASVYPVELFKEVGLLSEDLFQGEDDFEFSIRLKKYSYKLGCVKDAVVLHKNGQSVSWVSMTGKIYSGYLARLLSIKKHYGSFYWILWLVIFSGRILSRYLAFLDLSFFEGLKLVRLLIYNSYKLDKINKNTFFDSLAIQESIKTKKC